MTTLEDAQFLTEAVAGLGAPVYTGLSRSREKVGSYFEEHGMAGPVYSKGRTDLTREHTRRYLEGQDLGPWELVDCAGGRILLRNELMLLRVLHGTPFDLTPSPGRNRARIHYYRNADADLFGVAASKLLAVWTADPVTDEIEVRVVRPIGTWKAGRTAKTDIDFVLPRAAADEFDSWQFVPDDEGLGLPFAFDEDDALEEGEGSGA